VVYRPPEVLQVYRDIPVSLGDPLREVGQNQINGTSRKTFHPGQPVALINHSR
jgi:hypothetical protein